MGDGELDRFHAVEIGLVHGVLATRAAVRFLTQRLFQRLGHPVENRHGGQAELRTGFFQPMARFRIDQREQHQAGIALEFGKDALKMLPAANHRPEMANDVGILELGKRCLGQHFQRFAGGIGQQMQVDAVGNGSIPVPVENKGINHGRKLATSSGRKTLPDTSPPRADSRTANPSFAQPRG